MHLVGYMHCLEPRLVLQLHGNVEGQNLVKTIVAILLVCAGFSSHARNPIFKTLIYRQFHSWHRLGGYQ